MNGLVGASGMEPTICAVKAGVDVALSNKESMVMAGNIINDLLKKYSGNGIGVPVESDEVVLDCDTQDDYFLIKSKKS